MPKTKSPVTRRSFLQTSIAAAAGAASLPLASQAFTRPAAKYTRYNVMSAGGQAAINSYNKGIQEMLKLPPTHPHNWFRNAFVHLLDCPHGNWWFYVWHRGYLGFFEETIRILSGDTTFALPYWDWTTLPEIPPVMFDDARTPVSEFYEPYTKNFDVFTSRIQPALQTYWNSLSPAQLNQLSIRGYTSFDLMWNDVSGFSPSLNVGIAGNVGWAINCGARYLSKDNPKLDADTAADCAPSVIEAGLQPTNFYNPNISLSFSSTKTPSHNTQPGQTTQFSILEGLPHNIVHNYIGGVTKIDPGPYGNMTNFLSTVDPIFFLHHSNMDRLWDVWTRKQQSLGLPYLPTGADLQTLSDEPFLFFFKGDGQPVGPNSKAGEYLSMARFDYEYEPGFPNTPLPQISGARLQQTRVQVRGTVRGNKATLAVPSTAVREHLATPAASSLVAEVTVPHPPPGAPTRQFRVFVGGPDDLNDVTSPHFAGTIAFFGNMSHSHGDATATFAVPLPKSAQAFGNLGAATAPVNIRIVPAHGPKQTTPILRSATVRAV